MIEKVEKISVVPKDIKELLINEKGEYIAIGDNIYTLKPFGVKKYFELLYFITTYYEIYNEIFDKNDNIKITNFFGILSKKIIDNELIDKFMNSFFPEIPNAADDITEIQLTYLLGVIYKLNFLSKNLPIKNQEIRLAVHKMQEMLGLNLTHPIS
jgi:hypothetical protein